MPDLDALNLRAELMAPFSLQLCRAAGDQAHVPTCLLASNLARDRSIQSLIRCSHEHRYSIRAPPAPCCCLLNLPCDSAHQAPTRPDISLRPAAPCPPSSSGGLLTRPLRLGRSCIHARGNLARHRGLPTNRRLLRCHLVVWLIA